MVRGKFSNIRHSLNGDLFLVPVTDLKTEDFQTTNQTHVEKVSFEQDYNSRNEQNYPLRGKVCEFIVL